MVNLVNEELSRALLDGTKTQTRRAVAFLYSRGFFVLVGEGEGKWPYQSDDGKGTSSNDGDEHSSSCRPRPVWRSTVGAPSMASALLLRSPAATQHQ